MITAAPLRALMEERDLDLETLSMVSGIEITILKGFYYNRNINSSNINSLCKTLSCRPEDLIQYEAKCDYCTKPLEDFRFCPMCGRPL